MRTPDFFPSRLDQMIDLRHPLAVLSKRLPWAAIEAAVAPKLAHQAKPATRVAGVDLAGAFDGEFGGGVSPAGRPRLPVRLMVGLLYLQRSFNLSDEELVERWAENVQYQFFSGMDYYEPRLPCDATQIGRFRRLLGEEGIEQLLKATIDCAVDIKAVKPADLKRVIVDSTVQSKTIAHPVDSRLLEIAQARRRQGRGSYRGVDADNPGVQIIHRGKYKSLTDHDKRLLKRRQAIEPLIGHTKADHRMDRCWLQGAVGDALHTLSCAAGYNIRWLLRAIARLGLGGIFCALSAVIACLACVLKAMPPRTTAPQSPPTPRRRSTNNLPASSFASLG